MEDKAVGIGTDQARVLKEMRETWLKDHQPATKQTSDGSTASYYELPKDCSELQDLIAYRDMNAQIGEIFRACYRYGIVAHSPKVRDIKKIIFYAQAELKRLETYEKQYETS